MEDMAMTDLSDIEQRLVAVVHTVVLPLRVSKRVDPEAVEQLMAVGRDLAQVTPYAEMIPRSLVGTSLFVFTAMLAAAEHAEQPEPILDVAWQWEGNLREACGPS